MGNWVLAVVVHTLMKYGLWNLGNLVMCEQEEDKLPLLEGKAIQGYCFEDIRGDAQVTRCVCWQNLQVLAAFGVFEHIRCDLETGIAGGEALDEVFGSL